MGLKVGDDSKAYRYLRRAALIDLVNLQGNTREGIHAANAGGVWQVVIFGFAGVSVDEDGMLCIQPNMPPEWNGLTFRIHYLNSWLEIAVQADNHVDVKILEGEHTVVKVNGENVEV